MSARLRLDAKGLVSAITTFLDAARTDLSSEDHQYVLHSVVDIIDDRLDAQAVGNGAEMNLPPPTQHS